MGATKGVQLNADQLQSLKQSFVNANKPNTATPSIESSSNQDDLDSGIISSKPGAGLLWDKPYVSPLKESFEASLADASVSAGSDAGTSSSGSGVPEIDIDLDGDSNSRPPLSDVNLPANGPVGIVAPGDINPSKPIGNGNSGNGNTGAGSDEALTAPDTASASQGGSSESRPPADLDTAPSQTTSNNNDNSNDNNNDNNQNDNNNNNSGGGGVINAVVGGVADTLGLGNNNDGPLGSGIQVDLGPVLDAVATLLRGPIRSAIANRRSEYLQQRSTEVEPVRQTRRPLLPKIAQERGTNPNFIPIGKEQQNPFLRPGPQQRPPLPKTIPLRQQPQPQQRNANGMYCKLF